MTMTTYTPTTGDHPLPQPGTRSPCRPAARSMPDAIVRRALAMLAALAVFLVLVLPLLVDGQ
jgi:hypothetical protein